MTRKDVESVAAFVQVQLNKVEPGAHMILCGGYAPSSLPSSHT